MKKREKWTESFQQASEKVSQWRETHPRASFTEIENSVDEQLARVRVAMIQDLTLESELTDIKQLKPEARPKCPECGQPLAANGHVIVQTEMDTGVKLVTRLAIE